jgi:hypothetical protein
MRITKKNSRSCEEVEEVGCLFFRKFYFVIRDRPKRGGKTRPLLSFKKTSYNFTDHEGFHQCLPSPILLIHPSQLASSIPPKGSLQLLRIPSMSSNPPPKIFSSLATLAIRQTMKNSINVFRVLSLPKDPYNSTDHEEFHQCLLTHPQNFFFARFARFARDRTDHEGIYHCHKATDRPTNRVVKAAKAERSDGLPIGRSEAEAAKATNTPILTSSVIRYF